MSEYNISLLMQNDTLDLDELECIIHQMNAVARGWGHWSDKYFVKHEESGIEYIWECDNV